MEGAGLVAVAVAAADICDVAALLREPGGGGASSLAGLVLRIVEDLNLEAFARIVERTDGVEQTIDHVVFVVERQLHGDDGQLGEELGLGRALGMVPVEQAQELVAVEAVDA